MSNDYLLIIGSALFAMYIVLLIYIVYMIKTLKKEYDGVLEAIRRMRQKLNEEGLYLPTDLNVLERRKRKAEKMKKTMGKS